MTFLSPRLRPSVEPFLASTGDLYLLSTDGTGDLIVRDASPLARALIDALGKGGMTADGLTRELVAAGLGTPPQADAALRELELAGLLTNSLASERRLGEERAARYDRQLHYFADQAAGNNTAEEMQLALSEASVVVLGVGLGCWTLSALACAGVGRLVAVDHDRVELSNLNRQILYRASDLGRLKVEAADDAIRGLNSAIAFEGVPSRITSVSDVRALITDADFVVCTADSPIHDIGRWVNEACLEAGVPHLAAGQFPPKIRVGPTFVPGRTACLACQEAAIRDDFPFYDELVEQHQRRSPPAATLGFASGLIGSLLAADIVHWITGICEPATLARGLVFDLQDFSSRWEAVEPHDHCELGCVRTAQAPDAGRQGPRRAKRIFPTASTIPHRRVRASSRR